MNDAINVLGIPFANLTFDETIELLDKRIRKEEKTFLVTANPEIVMYSLGNPDYKEQLLKADVVVPDGAGIVLASKLLGTPLKERVAGFDISIRLLELAEKNGWKIFLLGGRKEANKKAIEYLRRTYPNLIIAGSHHGYFKNDHENIVKMIRETAPDIVFAALGFPKQEDWVAKNIGEFSKGLFIGVGGTIDILAGEAKRAPYFWRKLNLEWLYRLIKQPSRWKRMLALPLFVAEVLKYRKRS
ncbi:WecB/TagA/CpsF family glycosyltransferase [Bacillus sp. B-jedd]|uniref:WecB/TagA/CpsF family glycosyltransferase n=1 Tax=Bacillus sp. B-jedd TaxID=1476857 RepID=UPI0005156263|nr:WecB/TagA/CpsF family glycosyltransferase [Bacillus sp. B-jedd]CEG29082.1 putative N-acetylmannosaminyltransferase [Bacillus sp. B-jedd]